ADIVQLEIGIRAYMNHAVGGSQSWTGQYSVCQIHRECGTVTNSQIASRIVRIRFRVHPVIQRQAGNVATGASDLLKQDLAIENSRLERRIFGNYATRRSHGRLE